MEVQPPVALLLHAPDHLPQLFVLGGVRSRIGIARLLKGRFLAAAMAPRVVFQLVENALEQLLAFPGLNGAVQRVRLRDEPLVVPVQFIDTNAQILCPQQQHQPAPPFLDSLSAVPEATQPPVACALPSMLDPSAPMRW
ncbi:MAG: hypothetical protein P4L26_01470 [Terracidiphilus sp.]|nr:hypothetical protein [Terracidiphilus sp.]